MSSPFHFPYRVHFFCLFVCFLVAHQWVSVRALSVSLSEKLLGLPFGGRGGFGRGVDAHYVLESFADLSSESMRVLKDRNSAAWC